MSNPIPTIKGQERFNEATGNREFWSGSAWVVLGAANDSGAPSGAAGGQLGGTYPNPDCVASDTSTTATATTPTLGAAAQLAQTETDSEVYIAVGTAGTITIAIGPTAGVANVIVNGLAAAVGDLYTVRVPAGWYIAVTTSTTAVWTATAVTC